MIRLDMARLREIDNGYRNEALLSKNRVILRDEVGKMASIGDFVRV